MMCDCPLELTGMRHLPDCCAKVSSVKTVPAAAIAALRSTATERGASWWTEYQRCQRAHHLRHVAQLRTKPLEQDDLEELPEHNLSAFAVGILVHAATAYVRDGILAGEPLRNWKDVLVAAASDSDTHRAFHAEDIAEASRLVWAYFARYGADNGGFDNDVKILAVEHYMRAELGGEPYTARADAIIQIGDSIVVVDTKTRARAIGSDRERAVAGFATRPQFLGLSYLTQREFALTEPPMVLVDAIVKTKLPKFERLPVPMSIDAVTRWVAQQCDLAHSYRRNGDFALPNYSQCAPDIGSRCTYFNWCHGSDAVRDRYFMKGNAA